MTILNTPSARDTTPEKTSREWYTAEQTAAILQVHVTTVHEMCRQGQLVAIKTGRDWRISALRLDEKAALGDVHERLIREATERMADLVATRVLTGLAQALSQQYLDQQTW